MSGTVFFSYFWECDQLWDEEGGADETSPPLGPGTPLIALSATGLFPDKAAFLGGLRCHSSQHGPPAPSPKGQQQSPAASQALELNDYRPLATGRGRVCPRRRRPRREAKAGRQARGPWSLSWASSLTREAALPSPLQDCTTEAPKTGRLELRSPPAQWGPPSSESGFSQPPAGENPHAGHPGQHLPCGHWTVGTAGLSQKPGLSGEGLGRKKMPALADCPSLPLSMLALPRPASQAWAASCSWRAPCPSGEAPSSLGTHRALWEAESKLAWCGGRSLAQRSTIPGHPNAALPFALGKSRNSPQKVLV